MREKYENRYPCFGQARQHTSSMALYIPMDISRVLPLRIEFWSVECWIEFRCLAFGKTWASLYYFISKSAADQRLSGEENRLNDF